MTQRKVRSRAILVDRYSKGRIFILHLAARYPFAQGANQPLPLICDKVFGATKVIGKSIEAVGG